MKNLNFIILLSVLSLTTINIFTGDRVSSMEYITYQTPEAQPDQWGETRALARNPYIREPQTPEMAEREAKFKEAYARQRDMEAQRAKEQALKPAIDPTTEKIEAFTRKNQAIKIQRATRNYLKEKRIESDKRFNSFKNKIGQIADQSYSKFKTLICTADYINKTDWLYQFIETMESKNIFARGKDGQINFDNFTPEFEQQVSDPKNWLHEKLVKYLPEFDAAVYESFIEKAVEQMIKYKTSWTDAVSIPAPEGHGSGKQESEPLYPIVMHKNNGYEIILGKIFEKILKKDPRRLQDQDQLAQWYLPDYLVQLGLELSPKEITEQLLLKGYQKPDLASEGHNWENFFSKSTKFETEEKKLIRNHINFALSARQTFLFGQIIFDKNLEAFDELGGDEWLKKQPVYIQKLITDQIEKIKNAPKQKPGKFKAKVVKSKPVIAKK